MSDRLLFVCFLCLKYQGSCVCFLKNELLFKFSLVYLQSIFGILGHIYWCTSPIPTDVVLHFSLWDVNDGLRVHWVIRSFILTFYLMHEQSPSTSHQTASKQCTLGHSSVFWFGMSIAKSFGPYHWEIFEFWEEGCLHFKILPLSWAFLEYLQKCKMPIHDNFWLLGNWASRPEVKTY